MTSRRRILCFFLVPVLISCSLIFPPKFERTSRLIPRKSPEAGYTVREDGVVAYEMEGLRIDVEYMTDQKLNELFPQESTQGEYSTNPYTYGDYVDPVVGYVRNRFTVFRVTVHNTSFAKVELQPLRCLLTTNRKGEVLEPYGILAGSAANNFESYYRTRRGPSGNENYRFNMRMGIVRTNNYRSDEKIFKGENYGGFIVFNPLAPEVDAVTLHVRDFVLKFNAYDKPLQMADIAFAFDREVAVQAYEEQTRMASSEDVTRVRLSAASEVTGNVTGDITRDVTAIDAFVKTRLGDINPCFQREFVAGKASEGEIVVRFVILSHGGVEEAEIVSSSVVSKDVDECLLNQIKRWRFRSSVGSGPAVGASAEDTLATPGPGAGGASSSSSARVTATCSFEFIDMRPE